MLKLKRLRLWIDALPRAGTENMAWDEAVLELSELPVLRFYRWDGCWASVGIRFDMDALPAEIGPEFSVVKRITGGGIVYHDRDATFTLVVPEGDELGSLGTRHVYEWVHGALARVLTHFKGSPHRLIGAQETLDGDACFQAPALHDVRDDQGRKVAGGAQRRAKTGFMHQGSLITEGLEDAFWLHLAEELSEEVVPWQPNEKIATRARELVTSRYALSEWSKLA